MTNEFVFGYTVIKFPNVFEDPSKIDRNNLGYPYKGLWKNGVAQMPSFTGWGGEMATVLNPGGFEVGGSRGLFADKCMPSVSATTSRRSGAPIPPSLVGSTNGSKLPSPPAAIPMAR